MTSVATEKLTSVNVADRKKIDIKPGDTVRVWQKVEEKGKTRLQPFEGLVLARKHGNEPGATFTVRRMNDPYGVEKIFPLYSPVIDKIEILKRARVRRAKLYHIRKKAAREVKRKMRNMMFVDIATENENKEEISEDPSTDSTSSPQDGAQDKEKEAKEQSEENKKEEKVEQEQEKPKEPEAKEKKEE